MTHSRCVTWLIHCAWHDSFTICDMTHSLSVTWLFDYLWHDSFFDYMYHDSCTTWHGVRWEEGSRRDRTLCLLKLRALHLACTLSRPPVLSFSLLIKRETTHSLRSQRGRGTRINTHDRVGGKRIRRVECVTLAHWLTLLFLMHMYDMKICRTLTHFIVSQTDTLRPSYLDCVSGSVSLLQSRAVAF